MEPRDPASLRDVTVVVDAGHEHLHSALSYGEATGPGCLGSNTKIQGLLR